MISRTQILPAGLCVLLAASLIALPGCGSSNKRTAKKVDTAPVVTAKSSDEVAAESSASTPAPVEAAPVETVPAPAADTSMSADASMPAPEASGPADGSTRGRAFEEANASGAMSAEPAPADAAPEVAPAPAKRAPRTARRHVRRAAPAPAPTALADSSAADAAAPAAAEGEVSAAGGAYTVSKGDTISKIARTHHTTAKKLMAANHISDPRTLKVGQKLAIPQ